MELTKLLKIIEDYNLNQLIVGKKYNVIDSYYVLDELIVHNYGIGIYLGTYTNNKYSELLFYFNNEEHKSVNYSTSYSIEFELNKFITVHRFYDNINLQIDLID